MKQEKRSLHPKDETPMFRMLILDGDAKDGAAVFRLEAAGMRSPPRKPNCSGTSPYFPTMAPFPPV